MNLYPLFERSLGVCTDSRTLKAGQLFFALKGENFNGDDFAAKALEDGAIAAVVSEECPGDDPRLVRVPDTLEALRELAAFHRRALGVPVIGLTGTNGKTTTKELIREVLSRKFRVTATEGNLNNDIGVPLSVLKMNADTQIAIIEMGASHPEDLRPLLAVSQPDFGLITNVGRAHLEGFGSYEGVKHAKGLLYDWLKEHSGTVFANASDPVLLEMLEARGLEFIPYDPSSAKILTPSAQHPYLRMEIEGKLLETKLVGSYNAANVMAAVCIGKHFGVALDDALEAISAYTPANKRSQLELTGKNCVIVDAYNANPSSMAVALQNLKMSEGPKAALLGEMRELGADSEAEHRRLVRSLEGLDKVFLVGEEFRKAVAAEKAGFPCFDSSDQLAAQLREKPIEGYTILVKGSRGTRMEKVLDTL
ncbi:MAG: UDP-N-acetylmuramoyl-tripeptide--D-alanyl-D-alanine ligase [Bacteroidales bacterium]|nr:UDP-N-acetylmuramoyl-tripeptide--D-alanyl-D-alanine ligase [Bacteroidales bacterium]